MNCKLLETVVDDLASERYLETKMWEHALEHVKTCPACAERLAGARLVTALLRERTSALEPRQAPAEIETALRIRFRQQRNLAGWRRRKLRRTWSAIAAAILIAIAGGILWRLNRASRATSGASGVASTGNHGKGAEQASLPNSPAALPGPLVARNHAAQQNEPDGEFIPLPYAEGAVPLTGAQVVTVRLPASALEEIGFPPPGQGSEQYVSADILIGEDGIARAIRIER